MRTKRKGFADADKEQEGVAYEPDMFWNIWEQE